MIPIRPRPGWRLPAGSTPTVTASAKKNGVKLSIRWLTYPSRQELPLLAESAQSTLKDIGIDVQINCTKDHNSIRKDPTAWDIWVSANVNAGLGDPQNFFDTYCLDESVKNSGGHHSDKLEKLAVQLRTTFDPAERAKIAVEMQQQLLDDNSYVFCSFLRMSMIMKSQRLRSRSTRLRLLRAYRGSRYPVSKREKGRASAPPFPDGHGLSTESFRFEPMPVFQTTSK